MGSFKPLLPFGETTVIDSCIQHLRAGGASTIIVVVGHHATELKHYLKDSDVTFAVNPNPDGPMGDSIACGVAQVVPNTGAVLITPADHPAVPSKVVKELISCWANRASLVVPTWEDHGGHPVLVDIRFREELLRLGATRGLRGLFDLHRDQVTRVSVDSPFIARDMDTWDDYVALHNEVFGVPPKQAFSGHNSAPVR